MSLLSARRVSRPFGGMSKWCADAPNMIYCADAYFSAAEAALTPDQSMYFATLAGGATERKPDL